MPAFDIEDELTHPLDVDLLQNGHVHLCSRADVLDRTIAALVTLGYAVVQLDALPWRTADDLHDSVSAALDFPSYYGRNVHALGDCLSDVATWSYGASPDDAGMVIVVKDFDAFAARDRLLAEAFSHVVAANARHGLLFGHRILLLLHTGDAAFTLPPVGDTTVGRLR